MFVIPDSELLVRQGMEDKAAVIWATASRAHLNRDFQFNSQPLSVAFTERETIGGRAWPNVVFDDAGFDLCFRRLGQLHLRNVVVLVARQPTAKRPGHHCYTLSGITARTGLPRPQRLINLPWQSLIFDEFRDKELQPAYLADADPNRALLDRRVIRDLLGFDEDTYMGVRRLAAKWCAEPSVHGGKARPKDAKFVA